MKITTISYRRTINLGNCESATVEATAEIDPAQADLEASALVSYVCRQLARQHPSQARRLGVPDHEF